MFNPTIFFPKKARNVYIYISRIYEEELWCQYEEEKLIYELEIQQYRKMGIRPPLNFRPPVPPALNFISSLHHGNRNAPTRKQV